MNKFTKNLLSTICLVILAIPSILIASPFNSDSSLEIFPYNQTLNFEAEAGKEVSQSFSIQNTSEHDKRVTILGNLQAPFKYYGNSQIDIAAKSSTYVTIQFQTEQVGTYSSELRVQHNDTREIKTINLKAESFARNSNNGITINTDQIKFGKKDINSTSSYSITINNNNSQTIDVSTSTLSSPFQVADSPTQISPNSSQNIIITYKPIKEGNYNSNLTITTSDKSTTTTTISLSGSTTNAIGTQSAKDGKLNLSRSSVSFNNQPNTSQSQNITISNPNSFPVEVKLRNDFKSPFSAKLQSAINRKTTILAGQSKTLTLTFQPKTRSSYQHTFTLDTNLANNSTYKVEATNNRSYKPPVKRPDFPIKDDLTHPITSLNISKTNINPDLNEVAYFNLNLGKEFTNTQNKVILKIINPKTRQTIYTQSASNLYIGRNDWKIYWNGRNYQGNSMLAGNYEFELDLYSNQGYVKDYTGSINVTRNPSHLPQTVQKINNPKTYSKCSSYQDVKEDSNLCSAILFAESQNLLKAGETRFYPNEKVTRTQALSTIMKLLDTQLTIYNTTKDKNLNFQDTELNAWYMPFLKTAIQLNSKGNIIDTDKENFEPLAEINRAEMYKLFFELANNNTNNKPNFLMDYYLTQNPFQDTRVDSNYDWYTPYAGIAYKEFNGTNFSKKYFGTFQINSDTSKFNPNHQVTKEEFFEFLYETHKLKTVIYQ